MAFTVRASRTIRAPIDLVWEIMSDTDNEPSLWPGMKSVTNIRRGQSIIEREVEIILGYRCTETIKLYPELYSLQYKIYKGPIVGEKSIVAKKQSGGSVTKVEVIWTIDFRGLFRIFWPLAKICLARSSWRALGNLEKVILGHV